MTGLKPLDSAPRHKPINNVEAIQHARCLLYLHDFLSEDENNKVKQRIGKWLDKNNVSLVPAKGAKRS
jgi:hypothetical protein